MPILLLAGCTALSLPDMPTDPADSLAAAESAFAAQSVRDGMKAAFLDWLAPAATLFRGGPVNGPATIAASPDPPIVLDWRPVHVETAASGELGLSTGPWRITRRGDDSAPPRFGQFISIWRRDAMGAWRVHVDLGIAHPGPLLWDAPLSARSLPEPKSRQGGTLEEAEAAFASGAKRAGNAAAYAAWASASIRAYRDGAAPYLGREALLASVAAAAIPAQWQADRSETSAAQDFGFVVGRYSPVGGDTAGHFVRVWRREGTGWRIALDVTEALPRK